MWLEEIKSQIEKIKQSSFYEGDFGDTIEDESLLFNAIDNKSNIILNDYRDFMKQVGYGELDASFYVEDGPVPYQKVYIREIPELDGMYIFASDQSEYSYAFDSKNNFEVVDIDASGKLEKHYGDFKAFISNKVKEINEMVIWRRENL